MKARIGLAVLAVALVIAFAGCSLIDATSIKGTWKATVGGVVVRATFDGAGNLSTTLNGGSSLTGGKYSISGSQITLTNCTSLGLVNATYDMVTPSATNMQWQLFFTTAYDWTKQ